MLVSEKAAHSLKALSLLFETDLELKCLSKLKGDCTLAEWMKRILQTRIAEAAHRPPSGHRKGRCEFTRLFRCGPSSRLSHANFMYGRRKATVL